MSVPEIRPVADSDWDQLTQPYLDKGYQHTAAFGTAMAHRLGASSQRVAAWRGAELAGVAEVRIKRLPLLRCGIAYVSCGPLVRRGTDADLRNLDACLDAMAAQFVRREGLTLRILGTVGTPAWNEAASSVFRARGYMPSGSGRPYRTMLISLDRDLDAIRAALSTSWRNQLTQAERKGVVVREGTDAGMFDQFRSLFTTFVASKGFHVELDADFFGQLQTRLSDSERFRVRLAEKDGHVVAGTVVCALGDTWTYVLGASSDESKKYQAANLLQWHAIAAAHASGAANYDLGGIDPEGNPGVYHFKKGLGGTDVQAPGPFQLAPSGGRGWLVDAAERAYRWKRARETKRDGRSQKT